MVWAGLVTGSGLGQTLESTWVPGVVFARLIWAMFAKLSNSVELDCCVFRARIWFSVVLDSGVM